MHPKHAGTNPVIVSAPTGVVARNVNGYTLHSVFKLPVQRGYEPECHELSPLNLKRLSALFKDVHTLVIDEISMVSAKVFTHIHQRLCAISDTNIPMGGFNIILFGDFFHLRPVRGRYVFTNTVLWPLFTPFILTINKKAMWS